jgi:lipopolysaccharide export system protein LptA
MKNQLKYLAWCIFIIFLAILFYPAIWGPEKEVKARKYQQYKQVEVSDSTITGYEDDQLSWLVTGEYIWAGRSEYLFRVTNLQNGFLYDNEGRIVVKDLKADKVKVNSKSKIITAQKNISATLLKREKNTTANHLEIIKIKCDNLKYFSITKTTYLQHNVLLQKDDLSIIPSARVELDNQENLVHIKNRFLAQAQDFQVSANSMTIDLDHNYAVLKGQVLGVRKEKLINNEELDARERDLRAKTTSLKCQNLKYTFAQRNDIIELDTDIEIIQEDKIIRGQKGHYDKKQDLFWVKGQPVVFLSDSLSWLLNKQKKPDLKNKDIKQSMLKATRVTCQKLFFKANLRVLTMLGNVRIEQKDKTITCQKMVYSDEKQLLILTGSVKIKEKGKKTILTNKFEINILEEDFEAQKGVQVEFELNR